MGSHEPYDYSVPTEPDFDIQQLTDGRSRRAARTRQAIAWFAAESFVREGFERTSITSVAERAGVGVQTVYYHFPTKGALLVGAIDQVVDGADRRTRRIPLESMSWAIGARREPDPHRRLFLHVRGCADLLARGAVLIEMLRARAYGDPELAVAEQEEDQRRRDLHRAMVLSWGPRLSAMTTVEHGTDVLHLVLGPQSWNSLVDRAGWSRLAWARWAHRTLDAELLGDVPAAQ